MTLFEQLKQTWRRRLWTRRHPRRAFGPAKRKSLRPGDLIGVELLEERALLSATPTLALAPAPELSVVLGSKLTETATLSGGNNPMGTITFTLLAPNGTTVVDTESDSVSGNGSYTTPNGNVPTTGGVYQWNASYSGDGNNTAVDATKAFVQVNSAPVIVSAGVTSSAVPSGTPAYVSYSMATPLVLTGSPAAVNLGAVVTDDGVPNPPDQLTSTWSYSYTAPGQASPSETGTFDTQTLATPANNGQLPLHTPATLAQPGVYDVTLTVSDGQLQTVDDFTIYVNAPPTIVSAGATSSLVASGTPAYVNYSLASPVGWAGSTTAVNLNAIVTDDGLPNPPDQLTSTWSYSYTAINTASPAQTGTFGTQTQNTPANNGQLYFNTTATFTPGPGVYDVTLTVSDGQLQTVDDFTIYVNAPPTIVSAGATSSAVTSGTPTYVSYLQASPVEWAGSTTAVNLNAIVTDDGLPNPNDEVTSTWSYSYTANGQTTPVQTGTFGTQTEATPLNNGQLRFNTTATFTPGPGVYDVTLTVSDGQLQTVDDFTIYVNAPPVIVSAGATSPFVWSGTPPTYTSGTPPYVNYTAASPVEWTGPATAVNLNAIVTDDGLPNPPDTLTSTWSYTYTLNGQTSPVQTGTFGTQTLPTPANQSQLYFNTPATFTPGSGVYDVTLTVSDGQLQTVDAFTIYVNAPPTIVSFGATSPVVSSGTPPTYTSGTPPYVSYTLASPLQWAGSTTAVDLNAIATDDALPNPPDQVTATWIYTYTPNGQTSPTETGKFGAQTQATPANYGQFYFNTPATFSAGPGVYDVTLVVNDGQLQTVSPDFKIYVNSSAAITAPTTSSVNENCPLVFCNGNGNPITVTDTNAGSSVEQLTLTETHGILTLASTKGLTFSAGSNKSSSMTVKGTLTNLNAALNGLTFTPTSGYYGTAALTLTYKNLANNQTATASVSISVVPPASQPTVTIDDFLPSGVPGEPIPVLLVVKDTNSAAQSAAFTYNISFGDGPTKTVTAPSPLLLNHVYTYAGTFTVSVTATDEYGHVSAITTAKITIVPVYLSVDPFNSSQTALVIGGTSGNDTISLTVSGKNGTDVTLNGVNEGVFTTSGPVIVFGQGGKDTVKEASGMKNSVYLLESITADNAETDFDDEAIQWAGLKGAIEILNA